MVKLVGMLRGETRFNPAFPNPRSILLFSPISQTTRLFVTSCRNRCDQGGLSACGPSPCSPPRILVASIHICPVRGPTNHLTSFKANPPPRENKNTMLTIQGHQRTAAACYLDLICVPCQPHPRQLRQRYLIRCGPVQPQASRLQQHSSPPRPMFVVSLLLCVRFMDSHSPSILTFFSLSLMTAIQPL